MKKILTLFSAISLFSTTSATVVSCGEESSYGTLEKAVKNKETFVYFFGAKDCPFCQSMKTNVWWYFEKGQKETTLNKVFNGDYGTKYNLTNAFNGIKDQDKKEKDINSFKNINFYSEELDDKSKFFDDSAIKDVVKWILNKYETTNQISGQQYKAYTRKDIGLDAVPFLIFVNQGKYAGFQVGSQDTITQLLDVIYKHIVYGDITNDPINN